MMSSIQIRMIFNPKHILGLYWDVRDGVYDRGLDIYLTIIPTFPIAIHIHWRPLGL